MTSGELRDRERDGSAAVLASPTIVDVRHVTQGRDDAGPEHRVVVHDHHADRVGHVASAPG